MKGKKGAREDIVITLLWVFVFFLFMFIIITGTRENNKKCEEYGLKGNDCSTKNFCIKDCISLNKTFWKYKEMGGFRGYECWCIEGNTPIQIP